MKRFRSEATVLARLNHPVIATIYDLFTAEHETLIVMELVPGETLERICSRGGAMAPAHAVHIIDRVLSALDHAHRAGIVHCDIKPANIMVTAQGDVKIMDFGTARVPGKQQGTADKLMMGTPAYMSPEQVTGQSIDGRSDLYAVGIVLYRTLAGVLPFTADSLIGLMQKQIVEEPPPLATHRAGLPDWCEPIVRRAMAKSPGQRFQTAAEFSAALRSAGAVMRQPVGLAHPDPVIAAVAAERHGVTDEPTLTLPKSDPTPIRGGTVTLPGPSPATTVKDDWRPLAAGITIAVAVILALWRFSGGSMLSSGQPGRAADRPGPQPAQPPAITGAGKPTSASPTAPGATGSRPPQSIAPSGSRAALEVGAPMAPAVFEARVLMREGEGWKEHDCRVLLADGKIHVQTADEAPIVPVPYEDVVSIAYSRGRDPMWKAPGGPAQVARAGGGAFGIFRGTRHWVSLRTTSAKNRFLILRLGNDQQTKHAITLLEQRTGRHTQAIGDSDTR
ncbi:MAG TPA: serine/threonine-protein kinase [Vicinamibacterales bacterium]|nr:serine/threonine-protein kinase [Vicinamibacterales bacterium]